MAKSILPITDKKYEKKWVALSIDYKKIIDFADDAKKLAEKLEKKAVAKGQVIMMYVRPFDTLYAPTTFRN